MTAPGRQSANAVELLRALRDAVGMTPRVLSAESEGRLAYLGAVAAADDLPALIAVCDVGGGSTEVGVRRRRLGAGLGRLDRCRLAAAVQPVLSGRHGSGADVRAARAEVRRHLSEIGGVEPDAALATGGSARALRKLVGWTLGGEQLEHAIGMLAGRSPAKIARKYGIEARRARTLLAGAVILAEVQALLATPFEVARGGLREGLAAELLAELQAA